MKFCALPDYFQSIQPSQPMQLDLEKWFYKKPFGISRGILTSQTVLYASLVTPLGICHGEGEPHESDPEVALQMWERGMSLISKWKDTPTRDMLRQTLPADGLRNALDALLWDFECKTKGLRAWELAGFDQIDEQTSVQTMVTVTLDQPELMARSASALGSCPAIKVKLGERSDQGVDMDIERMVAVAEAARASSFVVDANEGWTIKSLQRFLDATRDLPILLIEQPLPAGMEDCLSDFQRTVPIAADESCTTLASLEKIRGRFDYINIKLDKSGGLTEALDLQAQASAMGLKTMVGCNCGTSLAMASAFVLATQCDLVDLDGPLHLQGDREHPIRYENQLLYAPVSSLWG